ncbi:MAG: hypothetical protein QNI91_08035 [Arenicellales bacterium]|nr:hypothetical protein [Arenicellales bacterium]
MATVTSWTGNIADIGPIYPMVGTEGLLFIIGLVTWIIWHIIQTKMENKTYEDEIKRFGDTDSLKKMIGMEDPRNP